MMKLTKQGAAFEVHPRCRTLIDGFEAGYVWEDLVRSGSVMPNTRRPKKDGYYDHLQNTAEYVIINYGGAAQGDWRTKRGMPVRDVDPADALLRPTVRISRAGY
jgi:hypothetical protein